MVRGWFQSRPKCDSNEAHHQSLHHHGWFQGFSGSESPAERMHKVAQSSRANATGATWWLSVGYEKNQHSEHQFRNYYILISLYIRIHVEYNYTFTPRSPRYYCHCQWLMYRHHWEDLRQYIGSMRLRTNFMPGVLSRVSPAKKTNHVHVDIYTYIYIYITLVVLLTIAMQTRTLYLISFFSTAT